MGLSFHSRDAEETRAAAVALARAIVGGAAARGLVLSLIGDLGVGKTVFVKGLAAGLAIDPDLVSSPTFVLANQYASRSGAALNHVDLYRLDSAGELETMGFFDLLDPPAIVAIEWADRFPEALPADHLEIRIQRPGVDGPGDAANGGAETADAGGRTFAVEARGKASAEVLASWRAELGMR